MSRFLRVACIMSITSFVTTAILMASIGTPGGNGQIPYIVTDSIVAGQDVNFEIKNIDPANNWQFYFFGYSTDVGPNGGLEFPHCGPGAIFVPDFTSPTGGIVYCTENPRSYFIPPSFAGLTYYCQAIIPDPNAMGGWSFSEVLDITFESAGGGYNFNNFDMQLEGIVPHYGETTNVLSDGDKVYFTTFPFGMGIFNKTPGNPVYPLEPAGFVDAPVGSIKFKFIGLSENKQLAAISNGTTKLWIVDVADPDHPHYLSMLDNYLLNLSYPVIVNNEIVLSATGPNGLAVISIADTANPQLLETMEYNAGDYVNAVLRYDNNHVIVLVNYSELHFYRVDGTAQGYTLAKLGNMTLPYYSKYSVHENGGSQFLVATQGLSSTLEIHDISAPNAINLKSTFQVPYDLGYGMTVAGSEVYLTGKDSDVHSYTISTNGSLSNHKQYATPAEVKGLAADANCIYMVGGSDWMGLHVFDKAKNAVVPSKHNNTYCKMCDMAIGDDGLIAVTCNMHDLYFVKVDENKLHSPTALSEYPGYGGYIEYVGGGLFCVSSQTSSAVKMIHVDLNGTITELGACATAGSIRDLRIDKFRDLAFVLDTYEGIYVIDIADPENPKMVHNYKQFTFIQDLHLEGNVAYLSICYGGVAVVDFTDASNPQLLGQVCPPQNYAQDLRSLCYKDGYVYSLLSSDQVAIFDCRDSHNPLFVDVIKFNDHLGGLSVSKNGLFITSKEDYSFKPNKRVYVYDTTNLESPTLVHEYYNVRGDNSKIVIEDERVYLIDSGALLEVITIQQ